MFNCKTFTETNPTSILSIWQNQVNLLRRLKLPVVSFLPLRVIKIAGHKRTGGKHATPWMGIDGELIIPDWRSLDQAQWASDGFAAFPTAALDPPHSAAPPAVSALFGSGSPHGSLPQLCRMLFPEKGKFFPPGSSRSGPREPPTRVAGLPAPAPKVFVPQSARAATLPRPASQPALAPEPIMH